MKYSKTVENDQFYTKTNIAKKCISLIKNLSDYDLIIEPSAGSGAFSNQISGCLAYDLYPQNDRIIEQDFLKLKNIIGEKILFIGNPPFGIRNKLSKNFITHAINLKATTIAFILPNVFNKLNNQKVFTPDWSLIKIYPLPDNSFIANGAECHIPCSFYIWTKEKTKTNLRKKEQQPTTDFSFLSRGDKSANFCINGNNGLIKNIEDVTNNKAEHYIKTDLPRSIFTALSSYYNFNSSVNGGVSWIGQQEILEAYYTYRKNHHD